MELDEKTASVIIAGFETEFSTDVLVKLEERTTTLTLSQEKNELANSEIIINLQSMLKWVSIKLTTYFSVPL